MATLKNRIVDLLSRRSGLTYREITDAIFSPDIAPQKVNQAARSLESQGILTRQRREDGRIVNHLTNKLFTQKGKVVTENGSQSGDSSEHREAEIWFLQKFSTKEGLNLTKKRFTLDHRSWIELDGFCEDPLTLCEAWAHIGPPKSVQKSKVLSDALKLLFVSERFYEGAGKRILLLADHKAAAHFQGTSWMAQCLRRYNIDIRVIELSLALRTKVQEAQKRQYR